MDLLLFSPKFLIMLAHLLLCLLVNCSIIEFFYFKKCKRKDFYFAFLMMTVAVFFLVYFMMSIKRGKAAMGVGLGLFGIFSILRYRTDTIPVREMAYLFVLICLSVLHALVGTLIELLIVDAIVVLIIAVGEYRFQTHPTKLIQYDNIEFIKPEKKAELIEDLEKRLGVEVTDVKVGAVDFMRDMAILRITYKGDPAGDVENELKITKSEYTKI